MTVAQWKHPMLRYSGDDISYQKAAAFLDDGPVEDWGCGPAYARGFFHHGYRSVDGTPWEGVDVVADLREYKSNVAGILIRHVLEHNRDWRSILLNALESCDKLALVIFTPFSHETYDIRMNEFPLVPDISFRKEDLTGMFPAFAEESFKSSTQYGGETIFYVRTLRPCISK